MLDWGGDSSSYGIEMRRMMQSSADEAVASEAPQGENADEAVASADPPAEKTDAAEATEVAQVEFAGEEVESAGEENDEPSRVVDSGLE